LARLAASRIQALGVKAQNMALMNFLKSNLFVLACNSQSSIKKAGASPTFFHSSPIKIRIGSRLELA
jgi:hypothetical protein